MALRIREGSPAVISGVRAEQNNGCEAAGDRWFSIRVKSRFEKVVAIAARNKGFEEFLPVYQSRRAWSDRSQSVDLPLFPGYVFCRLNPDYRLGILTIPGVMHFVGIGKTPLAIDDAEIAAIQSAVGSGLRAEPCPFISAGTRVRLEAGPLAGLEGFFVRVRAQDRVVVSISALKRSVAVEIDRQWISPVETPI